MKAAVLLSGGIDSTTCLAMAVKEFGADNVIALNMHYGQKHDAPRFFDVDNLRQRRQIP